MKNKSLSRRDFLKLAGVSSAGLALSACGVKASNLPTATPLAAQTSTSIPPTATTAPTLIPSPTVEVKLADLPQTKAAVDQFAAAMKAAGVQVDADQIRQGFTKKEITGKDDKNYEIVFTHDGYPQ